MDLWEREGFKMYETLEESIREYDELFDRAITIGNYPRAESINQMRYDTTVELLNDTMKVKRNVDSVRNCNASLKKAASDRLESDVGEILTKLEDIRKDGIRVSVWDKYVRDNGWDYAEDERREI
jgi:hypothetical protein